MIQKQ